MRFAPRTILAGAALAAIAGLSTIDEAAAAQGVTLQRGGGLTKSEVVAGGVQVVRGPAVKPSNYKAPKVGDLEVLGGERLWLLERARGRLTGCTLRFTGTVGREAIRCTARRLPHGLSVEALRPVN